MKKLITITTIFLGMSILAPLAEAKDKKKRKNRDRDRDDRYSEYRDDRNDRDDRRDYYRGDRSSRRYYSGYSNRYDRGYYYDDDRRRSNRYRTSDIVGQVLRLTY